ncbi:MAG: molybdate ABC transporter substrate-binding protein [Alphaproteobacteria bacterium]|nr:molybdate ABC transporter substrate-binding protein [Alphaproteobacteria bacterium]
MRRVLAFLLSVLTAATGALSAERDVTVFAAASLTNALQDVAKDYEASGGGKVKFSFAASSLLARQIEAGADADVFFSADTEWMDYLAARKLIRTGTRRDALSNRLVLIAPAGSTVALSIAPGFAIAAALGDSRLALADPDTVPAGKYAKAALTKLGVWDAVANKIARAENVRAALAYVARGEASLGIVYETDAKAEAKVRTVDTFPADTHPAIVYPVALTASANGSDAEAFLAYILSAKAAAVFKRHGFSVAHQ